MGSILELLHLSLRGLFDRTRPRLFLNGLLARLLLMLRVVAHARFWILNIRVICNAHGAMCVLFDQGVQQTTETSGERCCGTPRGCIRSDSGEIANHDAEHCGYQRQNRRRRNFHTSRKTVPCTRSDSSRQAFAGADRTRMRSSEVSLLPQPNPLFTVGTGGAACREHDAAVCPEREPKTALSPSLSTRGRGRGWPPPPKPPAVGLQVRRAGGGGGGGGCLPESTTGLQGALISCRGVSGVSRESLRWVQMQFVCSDLGEGCGHRMTRRPNPADGLMVSWSC